MLTIAVVTIVVGLLFLTFLEFYGFQFRYGTKQQMMHFMVFNVLCGRIAPSHWHLKEFRWIWGRGNVLLVMVPVSDEPYSLLGGF